MSRFFVDTANIRENRISITDPEDIRHIVKVLRLATGDVVDISDSAEFEYQTEIISIEKNLIEARILDKQRFSREPEIKVTLFQGIPKQGKMETIIQKAVELGVYAITPVFTHRTVVADNGSFHKKIDRWQKISDEAVKQCRRGIIPEVNKEIQFTAAIEELNAFDLILFPYENEDNYSIKACLKNLKEKPKQIAIFIGPEGGFSDEEAKTLISAGAISVSLGRTILRTETAGMAAIAMVMYELELWS